MVFNYGQFNDGQPRTAIPWTGRQHHDVGERFGLQGVQIWEPGENDERQVLDARLAERLWRMSVFGPVKLRLDYGTNANLSFSGLDAPVIANVPGQFAIYAVPLNADRDTIIECRATLTPVTQGCCQSLRAFVSVDPGVGDPPLELVDATSFVAFTDCILEMRTFTSSLLAFSRTPVAVGCFLQQGTGFVEYEP